MSRNSNEVIVDEEKGGSAGRGGGELAANYQVIGSG